MYRHIDGDHKLIQPYRFVIHGGIDGFSRLVVFLQASTNNRADTVLHLFMEAIQSYHLPSRVRSDRGLENIAVGRFMINARGLNRGSIITGNSVHNQRIERLWREVNRVVVSRFLNIFLYLEQCGVFDPESEAHLYCLHLVYLPLINTALRELVSAWNDHPVTTESNYTPRQMWLQGMLQSRNSDHVAVRDVIDNGSVELDDFGIEEEGPVPALDDGSCVVVPESPIHLSGENLNALHQAIASAPSDDNGIVSYITAITTFERIFQ